MTERQQYYKELIAHLVEKHYQVKIDLTKDTEVPLPNARMDMVFEIPQEKLRQGSLSPFPHLAELNILHIKAVNDRLTREDLIQYLGQLYMVATSSKAEEKSIALTIVSAEGLSPSVAKSLYHRIDSTEIPWIYRIGAEIPAYLFILEELPNSEPYLWFLPFQPPTILATAKRELRALAQKSPHTSEEALLFFWLRKLQPDFYKEIEVMIDLEEIVKELCPRTLQKAEEKGKIEGKIETLITILQTRFGAVPPEMQKKIKLITSAEHLDRLLKGAVMEQTFNDFSDFFRVPFVQQ